MENQDNSPNKRQRQDTKITVDLSYYETAVRKEQIGLERVSLLCNQIRFLDENGVIRETQKGVSYWAYIENGVLSFDKPLNLDPDE